MLEINLNTPLRQDGSVISEEIDSMADNTYTSVFFFDKDYKLFDCNLKARTSFLIDDKGMGRHICDYLGDSFDYQEFLQRDRINIRVAIKQKFFLLSSLRVNNKSEQSFLLFLYDLTQDQEDQSSLKESLLQSDLFSIYVYDGENFLFFNNAVVRMSGYTAEELNKMSVWDLLAFSEEKIKLREHALQRMKGEYVPPDQKFTILRKDGSHLVGYFYLNFIQFQGKKAILGIVIDITESRKFEKVIEQYQKLEMLNRMTQHIYHDFNNFLTVIMGYLSLIRDNLDPADPLMKHLDVAEIAGDKASGLVQELMSLSKKQDLNMNALNVNIVIGSAIRLLENSFVQKRISVVRQLNDSLPPIKADYIKLEQVFLNLLLNSIEAVSEKGAIKIITEKISIHREQLSFHKSLCEGEYVCITIEDDGCGVDSDKISLVWEPYFTTKKQKGGGLGLSVAYGIISAHNGDIQLESMKGKGTKIIIHLPISNGEAGFSKISTKILEKGIGKILIIEDDLIVKNMLAEVLKNLGYRVFDLSDGKTAVEFFKKKMMEGERMDLVILDMGLPVFNGEEVFQELKKLDPYVRVILSSGYYFDDAEKKKMKGIAGFLSKPYNIPDISKRIKEILNRQDGKTPPGGNGINTISTYCTCF